jgi:hypothetical protein
MRIPVGRLTVMFRVYRPEPWHQRQIVDTAIRLVEDYVAWADAHGARLATAGRDKDAAYARALRELGRDHLNLLHRHRHELLSRSGCWNGAAPHPRPSWSAPSDAGAEEAFTGSARMHVREREPAVISVGARLPEAV